MTTLASRDESGPADARLLVGIGAAAGGCAAFEELLKYIQPVAGCSVLLVHNTDEVCAHLIKAIEAAGWSATLLEQREPLVDRHVFIVPPGHSVEVLNGTLQVWRSTSTTVSTPIDETFHSLAEAFSEQSVGVILSGRGSDGTQGLKAIGEAGGITFTQSPSTAAVESMPQAATNAGAADYSLPIEQLGQELMRYVHFMLDKTRPPSTDKQLSEVEEALPKISEFLLEYSNHNFQHYKPITLSRRVMRRMKLLKINDIESYLNRLASQADERAALFQDLLIGVSSFFRDPEAFQVLARSVIQPLFEQRSSSEPIRVWVPGCASGEEAYTLAMLCVEEMQRWPDRPAVQIFATDIDEAALHRARQGAYPAGIHEQVPLPFLNKYFVRTGKQFHVAKELREMVLFCKHNLISDPPFIRQDMISCRNLLIYLGQHLQNKLIPLFHYALQPGGFLMLGPAENISAHQQLFRTLDSKHRIAQRREAAVGIPLGTESHRKLSTSASLAITTIANQGDSSSLPVEDKGDAYQVMQRIVLDEFSPKSAVINEDGEIVCSSGNLRVYLEIPTGNFQNSIFKLARGGLSVPLRALVTEAKRVRRRISHDGLSLRIDGALHRLAVTVQPMPALGEGSGLFMVVFQDLGLPMANTTGLEQADEAGESTAMLIGHLEQELEATRRELERSMQDMEAANEELKASNEELLSMNEELQSANEELELSKEEIQAGVEALAQANTDLENLLRSTQIATIFLDRAGRIRSFTPAATELYGLLGSDIGRPLSHLRPVFDMLPSVPSLAELAEDEVLEHTFTVPCEKTFMRRVLPYRTQTGDHDGIVLTFTDISEVENALKAAKQQEQQLYCLMDAIPALVAYVTVDRRYRFVNHAYCREFERNREELIGLTVEELIGPRNYAQVERQLDRAMLGESVRYECPWQKAATDPTRYLEVHYVPDLEEDGRVLGCYVLVVDITERKEQSLALLDRERQLQSLISSTAEGIYGIDIDGMCTFANGATACLLGYDSPHELLGKNLHALAHHSYPDGSPYPQHECLVYKSIEQGKEIHVDEEVFWRKDGTPFDVEYWAYPQYQDGELVGCVVTFLDVTQRRQWERDLEDREAHLRRVIDNMLGFVGILALDGTLLEANATAIEAAGISRDELVGKKFWDCYWFSHEPAVQEQLRDAIDKAVAGEKQRYDVEIRIANDRRLTIDFQLVPVFNDDGRVTHLVPSGIDISDRLRAEAAYRQTSQAIRDNEERLAMALRAGGMAAWEWTPDGSIWTAEVYDLLGISHAEEASVETFMKCIHPDDLPGVRRAWEHTIAKTSTYEQEFRIVRPDGSIRWVVGMGRLVRNEEGVAIRLFGVNWDSTKEHMAAESLRESERRALQANLAKSEFIANMSHEIRTPMTAVLGYTDLLLGKESDAEKIEHLRTIKRNGKFLLEIINDILDLSKIEAGKLEIHRRKFSPQEIFADVQALMQIRAKARNLDFRLGYKTPIPKVIRSDAKRFKQILVNLVGNAIKFTEKGRVDLWVSFERNPEPRLRFDVIDTGIGMSPEQQTKLFQSFSQGDASVNRKFGGTGLGLAISRRLAKMLGGEIWVHSERHRGSTFSCVINAGDVSGIELIDGNGFAGQTAEHERAVNPVRLNCRVLVVDDRRDVRHLTRHFLTGAGAAVELAEDGLQAIERISAAMNGNAAVQHFDLILLDMQMPRLDGYETARALRQMGFKQPIIALTADAMQGDMSRCIESGCDSYVSKPIDGPALVQAVAQHLAR